MSAKCFSLFPVSAEGHFFFYFSFFPPSVRRRRRRRRRRRHADVPRGEKNTTLRGDERNLKSRGRLSGALGGEVPHGERKKTAAFRSGFRDVQAEITEHPENVSLM